MRYLTLMIALAALFVAGCASSLSGGAYERRQARTVHEVEMGVVENVRAVKIEGTESGIGSTAGAVVGGLAGSTLGKGRGSAVGAVIGAVAGGVAGTAVEEGTTRQDGIEITVKLDNGRIYAIVQAADEEFKVGERIRVLRGGGVTRVTH